MDNRVETGSTRRQQAEERREQILDAALSVFAEKGFAGASIRDIARAAGVTEGLIYHYFDSKEQLEQACWRERSWHAHVERILAAAGGVPLETVLRDLVQDSLETLYENGPKVRMCAAEMQRNTDMAAEHLKRIEETERLICEFVQARQQTGEVRADIDVEVAVGLLMGCAYSMFLLWGQKTPEEWEPLVRQFVREGVDIVMNGIAPQRK